MTLTEENIIHVPGMLSRWVRLSSGAKVHYMTSGETGPSVVLLHGGAPGSSGTAGWRYMAPFLGDHGFRVYCPDQPGFGLTDDPQRAYILGRAGHVDFLHDFTTALALDQFHLGGNSMGCSNSVAYACAHAERVLSLALIAGSVGDLVPYSRLDEVDKRPGQERPRAWLNHSFDGTEESMRKMLEAINHRSGAITDDLLAMRTAAAKRNPEYQKERNEYQRVPTQNLQFAMSTKGRFDKLTIPAIYAMGRDDVVDPPEWGHMQEDACPNVQFFYPDDTGHQAQTDQPDMINQLFLELFRDGHVSRKTADWAGVSTRRAELVSLVSPS